MKDFNKKVCTKWANAAHWCSGEGSSTVTSWVSWVFSVTSVTSRHHPLALNHRDPMPTPARWPGEKPVSWKFWLFGWKKWALIEARNCVYIYKYKYYTYIYYYHTIYIMLWCHVNIQYLKPPNFEISFPAFFAALLNVTWKRSKSPPPKAAKVWMPVRRTLELATAKTPSPAKWKGSMDVSCNHWNTTTKMRTANSMDMGEIGWTWSIECQFISKIVPSIGVS